MTKELEELDPPVPSPKLLEKPDKNELKEKPAKKEYNIRIFDIVAYLVYLLLLVSGYIIFFEKIPTETSVASIGLSLGFILAILLPATLIWKQST